MEERPLGDTGSFTDGIDRGRGVAIGEEQATALGQHPLLAVGLGHEAGSYRLWRGGPAHGRRAPVSATGQRDWSGRGHPLEQGSGMDRPPADALHTLVELFEEAGLE